MAQLPLIELKNVGKDVGTPWKRKTVLAGVTMGLHRRENHAILALRDASVPSANTLLNIIAGVSRPSTGRVVRRGTVSVPLASTTQISPYKTPQELAFFLARLYNADPVAVLEFAADFAKLPAKLMRTKMVSLTLEERLMLGFSIGYALPADLYCFEQATGWGSEAFRERCKGAFEERRLTSATVITTDNVTQVASLAHTGSVLHKGRLYTFATIGEAVAYFNNIKLSHEETSLTHLRTLIRMGEMHWMSQYLDQVGPSGVGTVEKYTILAELALQNRRFDEAIKAAQAALDEGGSPARLRLLIAKAHEAVGNVEQAIQELEAIVGEEDPGAIVKTLLARNLERTGELARAGVIWRTVAIEGESAAARHRAEQCLLKTQQWDELIPLTAHCLSRNPDDLRALELRFKALASLRSWPETISVIKRVADVDIVKALFLIYQAVQTDDWPVAITLVKRLPRDRLSTIRDERLLNLTLILLRRRRQAAHKDGETLRVTAADEVIALLESVIAVPAIEDKAKSDNTETV